MNYFRQLKKKINEKQAKICIVGLGYVGLPLAVNFAKLGFFVYGFDTNTSRIDKLKKGKKYIVDIEPEDVLKLIKKNKFFPKDKKEILKDSDIIIICVPTPLRKVKTPDISFVKRAAKTIKKYIKPGQLIVLESTSYPTTTREIVLPELKKSGLREEKDFFLCFSPERVNPGDKKHPITKIPKVVGGLSSQSTQLAKNLYSTIMNKIHTVSNPEVAETSKLLENTYRLVNIALISEFTMVAEKLGINIWEVIEAASTKPFGFMPFYPGPGIGGHCIPCDPKFLSWKSKKLGFKTKMVDLASYMNHFMPEYVIKRVDKALGKKRIENSKILILGVTYKKDVKDLRESPALDIIEKLQKRKAKVDYYDPFIPYIDINNINIKRTGVSAKNIKKYDCIIIVTDHSKVDYAKIRKNAKLIFDTRNVYKKDYPNVRRL
ncbi:MAG: nucleotide sugar dehydrogenase [Candidatus Omnitrophica bacterium]|nr:nucleotide sugar dehydrogenase [Candidatus Omnitrophota bacterium]MCF7878714.1 nucleotide sugar dehydrogenase [Candidatus Omnitrophota bacterium]MCF7892946.1 nucleotide sugar dehydrogenase [Candidatus Omnitrophota bacterium]